MTESYRAPTDFMGIAKRDERGTPLPKRKVNRNVLGVYSKNVGRVYAQYVTLFVTVPKSILREESRLVAQIFGDDSPYKRLRGSNQRERTKGGYIGEPDGPPWYEPVLPSLGFGSTWPLSSKVTDETLNNDEMLHWEVYADNSFSTGDIRLGDIEHIQKVNGSD